MADLPSTPAQLAPPRRRSRWRAGLLLAAVGLLEAGFVTLLLAALFLTLNYFNVLRLSSFPALAMLPHLSFAPTTSPFSQVRSAKRSGIDVPTGKLIAFVETTIREPYRPYDVQEVVDTAASALPSARWTVEAQLTQVQVDALDPTPAGVPQVYTVAMTATLPHQLMLTPASAPLFARQYFAVLASQPTSWACHQVGVVTRCQALVATPTLRAAFAVWQQPPNASAVYADACFVLGSHAAPPSGTSCPVE